MKKRPPSLEDNHTNDLWYLQGTKDCSLSSSTHLVWVFFPEG